MPDSVFKTSYTTVTLLGMVNQFHSLADLNYETMLNTTINSKRGVQAAIHPTKVPTINYFGIGINGFYNIDDATLAQPYKPHATNMDLHTPIPFRCVPYDADLTDSERLNYRMRTLMTVGGEQFWAYWLKKVIFPEMAVKVSKIDPITHEETPYTFDPNHLNPVPTKLDIHDVGGEVGRVAVTVTGQCSVTGEEVVEGVSVLYDGDLRRARVSEFGFYTGEEKTVSGPMFGGGTINYQEAIYAQLAAHRCTLGTDLSDPTSSHSETVVFENGSLVLL